MDERILNKLKELYKSNNFDFDEGKDLYSNYASQLFNLPYEDCLEFKDGRPNPIGKQRRQVIKFYILCSVFGFGMK